MNIYRRNTPCQEKSRCKGPKAAVWLEWSENGKKALGSRVVRDEVRDGVTDQIMQGLTHYFKDFGFYNVGWEAKE